MSDISQTTDRYNQPESGMFSRGEAYRFKPGETEAVFHSPDEMRRSARASFRNDNYIRSAILPEGIVELPDGYFYNCKELESVTLPSTLKRIGRFAFYNCSALKEIRLPQGLREVMEHAFAGCSALSTIEIPQSVESLGTAAFRGCSALTEIILEGNSGITEIGSHCLQFCSELRSFSLPKRLEKLCTSTFYGCKNIRSITVPKSVAEVQDNAFFGSSLTEVCFLSGDTLLQTHALKGLEQAACVLETVEAVVPVSARTLDEAMTVLTLANEGMNVITC